MNTTPNLGLKKPLQTEFYNVDDFNYNSDAIDQAIHDLSENKQDKLSTSQMNAVNSGMTAAKREKLDALPTASELNTAFNGKQNTLTTAQLNAVNSGITSAKVSKLDALPTSTQLDGSLSTKANKTDITNISITGSTNNTGTTISTGTLFYWNGALFKATTDIPNNSTIVLESNCSPWTTFIEMGIMFSKTDNLTVTNNNSMLDNCTSLASVWQAVKWNYLNGYGKICASGIGALDNTIVKNVIPNPPGFGNYTTIRCKFEASEDIIAIYAIGSVIGKLAKCYLFRDRDNYYLTDWQILK